MKKVILLIVVLFPLVSFAKNSNDTTIFKKQYYEMGKQIKNLEEKVNADKIVLKKAETALEISNMYSKSGDVYAKSADKSLNLIINIIKIFGILIAILGVGGIIGLYKSIKKGKKNLEDQMKKEISEKLAQKESTILELFDKHEKEKGLLTTSRILILNKIHTDINKYELEILNKFKHFTRKDIELITYDYKTITKKDFDVVVFDNTNTVPDEENWDFENQEILKDKLVEIASSVCEQNIAFIFFGKNDGKFINKIPQHSHLISFSNNPATLFSNLMNLLELRRLLGII